MSPDLSQQRVNYDRIAHLYDEPLRDHDVDSNLILFLNKHPALDPANLIILDMGCGTGKQLAANRKHFPGVSLVGLDLFRGMLQQAQRRCSNIFWVQGDSAMAPFRTASFHYITNQFSYSHVQEKEKMLAETYRLLKPGGRFVMTHIDPWSMSDWIIYRYFPAAQARDYHDFLRVENFVELMQGEGFTQIQFYHRDHSTDADLTDFLEYASQRFRTSQLLVIPDADYLAGLRRIRSEISEAKGQGIRVKSAISFVTIIGAKPISPDINP